ncbi:uncharacterized protein LOC129597672 [Paramacrobiotus metropolitanus]|uniref:uncharacterized protein LOC129597672 n=1 Tax=Paramacrobiotus metropolitanus TaxID=2943436 RepID=UPI002445FD48|nr:uncharacterized protein LOC129597672 [Paramacrobiotus metropolitanus]
MGKIISKGSVLLRVAATTCLLIGCGSVSHTVKPLSGNRVRTVEVLEDEPVTLECSNAAQPFMELRSALFMESYKYDTSKGTCGINPAFCQPSSNLLRAPEGMADLFSICFNNSTCTLSFTKADRQAMGFCGLTVPMRLVVTFRCSDKRVGFPEAEEKEQNSAGDSISCLTNSRLKKFCGR